MAEEHVPQEEKLWILSSVFAVKRHYSITGRTVCSLASNCWKFDWFPSKRNTNVGQFPLKGFQKDNLLPYAGAKSGFYLRCYISASYLLTNRRRHAFYYHGSLNP
ncbi:hypothetical protein AVEN_110690-1 [Araneus ventricosus]|uniref:Uncharacterized protein n=1 Tax=Araneus ventricosus TaxID=182803 RepID=A0A4Y2AU78_ARAVE|nr:hypothetical protein AVEN_110690-1 [Araneus ventricosus]